MTSKNTANSVRLQIENARNSAIDATKSFATGIETTAAEAAELSRLENLPPAVRTALSRLDQMIRNELNNINDIINRNTPNAVKRNVYLLSHEPQRQPASDIA